MIGYAKLSASEKKRIEALFEALSDGVALLDELSDKYADSTLSLSLELMSEELRNAASHEEDFQ